jgi:hypothetical protein
MFKSLLLTTLLFANVVVASNHRFEVATRQLLNEFNITFEIRFPLYKIESNSEASIRKSVVGFLDSLLKLFHEEGYERSHRHNIILQVGPENLLRTDIGKPDISFNGLDEIQAGDRSHRATYQLIKKIDANYDRIQELTKRIRRDYTFWVFHKFEHTEDLANYSLFLGELIQAAEDLGLKNMVLRKTISVDVHTAPPHLFWSNPAYHKLEIEVDKNTFFVGHRSARALVQLFIKEGYFVPRSPPNPVFSEGP